MSFENIIKEIEQEREYTKSKGISNEFDLTNSAHDWISYITHYNGRATVLGLDRIKYSPEFRTAMLKVANLAIAAIEAHDENETKKAA